MYFITVKTPFAKTPFAAAAVVLLFCSCDGNPSTCRNEADTQGLLAAKAQLRDAEAVIIRVRMMGSADSEPDLPHRPYLEPGPVAERAVINVRAARKRLDEVVQRCNAPPGSLRPEIPP